MRFPDTNMATIEKKIERYLAQSVDRDGGRRNRRIKVKRNKEQNNIDQYDTADDDDTDFDTD